MKVSTAIAIAAAIIATGTPAVAAKAKDAAYAQREASCKAQAAKKYTAIHFLKRRDFVKNCMGEKRVAKKMKPSTTGQRVH